MSIIKIVLKILSQVVTLILFCLLLLAIYGKVQMIVLKQNYATFFGYTMFQVASNSMEPVMKINDVILVKKTSEFRPDEIISFMHEDSVVTHRVLSINNDEITVKGDANNTIDAPINKSAVIGKVVKVFPNLKAWQQIFTDPKILLFLFLTLILFDFAFSYKGKSKAKTLKERVAKIKPPKEARVKESVKLPKEEQAQTTLIPEKSKDVIEAEDLLELTRRISLDELEGAILNSDTSFIEIVQNSLERKEAIDPEDLLSLTQKLDLKDLNVMIELDEKNIRKMNLEELFECKERLDDLRRGIKKNDSNLDYTIRLDLKEIQKQISKKIKIEGE